MASNRLFFALSSSGRHHHQQVVRGACKKTINTTNTVNANANANANNSYSYLRRFSSDAIVRPQQPVTAQQRIALRAARKERAAKFLNEGGGGSGAAGGAGAGSSQGRRFVGNKYFWYATFIVPSGILVWGLSDSNSPPAKFCELIGLTGFLAPYFDDIAKPSHEKLLPDWSQVRDIM